MPKNCQGQGSSRIRQAWLDSMMMTTAQHTNKQAKLRYPLFTNGRTNRHKPDLYCFG